MGTVQLMMELTALRSWFKCVPGKNQSCPAMCQKRASHHHPSPPRAWRQRKGMLGIQYIGCWTVG